ncbi:MAG: rhodanese-like domain-containing protein [Kiloniellales bacterium]|nr:rhodanese-like domain-containing protein [Kiloniellales bacterium]
MALALALASSSALALVLTPALGPPAAAQETSRKTAHRAGAEVIAADRAMRLAADRGLVLIDVRSPQEWRQTGVPAGARLVTIHQPDGLIGFLEEMNEALGADRERPIALICARGNRSTLASAALAEAGYSEIYNVREGMLGSPDGPGWLARGLPTDPCGRC